MAVYSYSRLEAFKSCPLKYKFTYVDRIKRRIDGIEAFMGSRVHEVLEKLYTDLKYQKLNTLQELHGDFEARWGREWHDNIVIRKIDYTADNYFEMGRKCISDFYDRYYPFNHAMTLGLEKEVRFSLDPEGLYQMIGYIDRLDQNADGFYEIHDYKCSGSCPEQPHFDKDRQLALYQIALGQVFTDVKDVELVWHYLVFDKEFRSRRVPNQLETLKTDTIELIKMIEATEEFKPTESPLCDWCDYPDLCPKQKHFFAIGQLPVNEYLNEPGVVLVDKLSELEEKKKAFKAEIEEEIAKIKDALVKYAESEGVSVVRGSAKKAKIKIEEIDKYPASGTKERKNLEELIELAGCLPDVSSFDLKKLAKVVESGTWGSDFVSQIKEFVVKETKSSITLSKLNDKDLILEEEIRD